MKNGLLLIGLFLFTTAFGQNLVETRTASLVDGDYTLQGTVYLEAYDDNSLNLRFDDDYMTQANVFDVHVFLTSDNNYTEPIDTTGMLLVENIGSISGLNYSSGAMTFNLPAGVGISDYDHIVFVCIQFGQLHWGNGSFGAVVPVTSGIEEIEEFAATIYPNPSTNGNVEVKFDEIQQNVLVEVLDVEGRVLSSDKVEEKQEYSVELKESGTYFLRLSSEDSSTIKKVVRR